MTFGAEFDWLEHLVFALMLGISGVIGVYFGFIKGGQDTVDGYFLGGKNMRLFPVSASLICSFNSGVTLLGIPAEIYTHGTQFLASGISYVFSTAFVAFVMVPMFYKMQMVSLFQYLEKRFNRTVRKLVSFSYVLYMHTFTPIVIYGPALALNQVSGLPVHLVSVVVSAVCIFYTTVGGLKAVVWTDTLQGVIMVISVILVAVIGTLKVGGFGTVMDAAEAGERLEFFNLDFDPRQRSTFWSVSFGLAVLYSSEMGTNPSYMQRFISLPTMRKAQWSMLIWALGGYFFALMTSYLGLVAYTVYKDCDPQLSGMIERGDQIMPLFIVHVIGSVKGLPGVFIAGVVSAALSTLSGNTNTVAGILYADFVEPIVGKTTEARASNCMKLISVIFGVVCLFLVLIVEKLGAILDLTYAFGGVSEGVTLGIFLLGMFFPQANSKGATAGGMVGFILLGFLIVGQHLAIQSGDIVYQLKPVSVDGCQFNITGNSTVREPSFGNAFLPFEITYYYYCPLGAITVILVGLLISYATGPNDIKTVNRDLLSPLIYRLLPEYTNVPTKDLELSRVEVYQYEYALMIGLMPVCETNLKLFFERSLLSS